MKINHTAHISTNRHFCTISPNERFEENLLLKLSFSNENNIENFTHGFIDFHYRLLDGFKEIKRVQLTASDFLKLSFTNNIYAGDLLMKIRIGVYFESNLNHELKIELNEISASPTDEIIDFDQLLSF